MVFAHKILNKLKKDSSDQSPPVHLDLHPTLEKKHSHISVDYVPEEDKELSSFFLSEASPFKKMSKPVSNFLSPMPESEKKADSRIKMTVRFKDFQNRRNSRSNKGGSSDQQSSKTSKGSW